MADYREVVEGYLVPLPKKRDQNSKERKSGQCTRYLKELRSKLKYGRKDNRKRRFCSDMDLSSIKPEQNIITLTDNGKFVSRRSSFQNDVASSFSHYEHLMLENLLGLSSDADQKTFYRGDVANPLMFSKIGNTADLLNINESCVKYRENISNRRLKRRDAVAQVTSKNRDVLIERLRAVALENSLIRNGLLK